MLKINPETDRYVDPAQVYDRAQEFNISQYWRIIRSNWPLIAWVAAGVVGLAVARWLALKGFETLILEAETGYGAGVSSRNSEVIHAGLYYPDGSLKAALCVEGRRLLYDYCASRRIPHRRTEKLVFAAHETSQEVRFEVYDPNYFEHPGSLVFDRATRSFIFPATKYYNDGPLDVYEIFESELN